MAQSEMDSKKDILMRRDGDRSAEQELFPKCCKKTIAPAVSRPTRLKM
jgi:hypothetical protein